MKRSASSIWLDCLVGDNLASPRLWSSHYRTSVKFREQERRIFFFNALYSENYTPKALLGLRGDIELKETRQKSMIGQTTLSPNTSNRSGATLSLSSCARTENKS